MALGQFVGYKHELQKRMVCQKEKKCFIIFYGNKYILEAEISYIFLAEKTTKKV